MESIEKSHKATNNWIAFILFFVCFLLIYAIFCSFNIEGIVLRLCTWTLPVLIYLRLQSKKPVSYLKLQTTTGIFWAFVICAILYGLGSVLFGATSLNLSIPFDVWWNVIILVGLSEEVVFRGFILQQIEEMTASFWIGNLIQTMLFALTHVPYWLSQGQLITPGLVGFVLIAGFILGIVLKKTQSLWTCMFIHSVNNFCSIAIVYSK